MNQSNVSQHLKYRALDLLAASYNQVMRIRNGSSRINEKPGPISEIEAFAKKQSDISDHLTTLFIEAAAMRPSMIVELGVRSGQSTVALSKVADLFDSSIISVDLDDCSQTCLGNRQIFVKSDDVVFAQEFSKWCQHRTLTPSIDVLFIDTSHEFHHTVAEIRHWFPLLSSHCKVLFHDTNMRTVYFRKNGTIGIGWPNQRGVIGAIEQYCDCKFDERRDFTFYTKGWILKHFANCNGLTIMERIPPRCSSEMFAGQPKTQSWELQK